MIQVWLGDNPLWRVAVALARAALAMSVKSLQRLLQSHAGDPARRSNTRPILPNARLGQSEFEQWIAQYQRPLLEYLYGMTRDRESAADLAQETFLRAYTATSNAPEVIEHPQAWLYRIATNVAISALRRKRRFNWLSLSVFEPEAAASGANLWRRPVIPELRDEDIAVTVVERDAVWSVLDELPPRWRAALLLQTTGGFETREIAAQLGVSETNARKILFRAKERFRQIAARRAEAEMRGGSL